MSYFWDIDYNSDNSESEFMTIKNESLWVTLDSIRNYCDVCYKMTQNN